MKYLIAIVVIFVSIGSYGQDIKVKEGDNIFLFINDIQDCITSTPGNYSHEILGNILKLKVKDPKEDYILVYFENGQTSLLKITGRTMSIFTDMRCDQTYKNRKDCESVLSRYANRGIYYNASTIVQVNQKMKENMKTSSLIAKTKDLTLGLVDIFEDYQLQYYSVVLNNSSEQAFIPSFLKIEGYDKDSSEIIIPVSNSILNSINTNESEVFIFSIPKDEKRNIRITIKDLAKNNRSIILNINKQLL